MTDQYIGKACPFCQTRLTAADQVKVCPRCQIPHHADCWAENGKCTTYGCPGEGTPGRAVPIAHTMPTFSATVEQAPGTLPGKNPVAACLLNVPLAGVGYFYLGLIPQGMLALLLALIAGLLSIEYYCLAAVPVCVFAMVDCYALAERMSG